MSKAIASDQLLAIATTLDRAAVECKAIPQFPDGAFTLEQAYAIQALMVGLRRDRREKLKGIKLGFTSRAKMLQMGVNSLIWGWVTDAMIEEDGSEIDLGRYIHPRVEPEICFLTRRAIDGPLTLLEAADYVEAAAPAMEIIDSRFTNFKFNLENVVADNCSSAGLVVGAFSRRLEAIGNASVRMSIDGRTAAIGSTAAILGDPLRSVVQASRLLMLAGAGLPAGSLIMAGAATAAEALNPGVHVAANFGGSIQPFGRVEFTTRRSE